MSRQKSENLRIYIVAFRIIALLIGLILTKFNADTASALVKIPSGGGLNLVISLFLIAYSILAALWFTKFHDRTNHMAMLSAIDAIFGLICCATLGTSYMVMAIALPTLEAAYAELPWPAIIIILTIFGIMIFAGESLNILGAQIAADDPDAMKDTIQALRASARFKLLVNFVAITIPTIWAYLVALKLENEKVDMFKQGQEEKQIIAEDSSKDKDTIQGLSNALIEKDAEIERFRTRLSETCEELETNYKKYNEQKNQNLAQNELFREKENEMNRVFEKRIQKMESDIEAVKTENEKSLSLLKVSIEVNKTLSLQEVYVSIIENCVKLIPVDTCIIFMLDMINGHTEIFAEMVYSQYSEYFRNFSLRMGEGIPGLVAERQIGVIIDDGSVSIGGKVYTSLIQYDKSTMAVPILYEEEVLGVLYLGKQASYGFTPEMQDLATTFTKIVAVALQNAQLFQKTISGGIFDDLTGLYNSIYFNERFSEEIKRSKRYKSNLSLLLIDIDNFIQMNNDFGTAWGDDVLKEAADVIREQTRDTDVSARIQAGQFVVILLQSDKVNAGIIAERIRTAFETKNMARMKRSRGTTTISLGVSNYPSDADDRDPLIAAVEQALNKAKQLGGNRSVQAVPDL